jgi:hypothetical protein
MIHVFLPAGLPAEGHGRHGAQDGEIAKLFSNKL